MISFNRKIAARLGRMALVTSALPAAIAACGFLGFRINLTPSEPLGLWRIAQLERSTTAGDLVFVCPPATEQMRQARERGYLRSGICPSGYAPLIKTVAATSGQNVSIGQNVTIDGIELDHSALSARDGAGRALVAFAGGIVPAGQVFLHSDFVGSYDSRYFGPIPASGILGMAERVLTYAP